MPRLASTYGRVHDVGIGDVPDRCPVCTAVADGADVVPLAEDITQAGTDSLVITTVVRITSSPCGHSWEKTVTRRVGPSV